jgi:hypothetical protein
MSRDYVCTQFPETIGTCELCGVTDHHLMEGACPGCRARYALAVQSGEEVPLGVESFCALQGEAP